LLQYEFVKSGRLVTGGCKIIVDLVNTYNGKVTILNSKIKLLNNIYIYIYLN